MPNPSFSVCVYCGSRPGRKPSYSAAATAFGTALADEGWRLVYGAGEVGLMGDVARAARTESAPTLGVIPRHLVGKERTGDNLSQAVVTETMHERKKVMFMNADAVVVLPGGAGTLDEFFEVLTWAQLGLHAKPIVLLDIDGYWQPLVSLLRHVVAEELAPASLTDLLVVAADVPEAMAALRHALQPSSE